MAMSIQVDGNFVVEPEPLYAFTSVKEKLLSEEKQQWKYPLNLSYLAGRDSGFPCMVPYDYIFQNDDLQNIPTERKTGYKRSRDQHDTELSNSSTKKLCVSQNKDVQTEPMDLSTKAVIQSGARPTSPNVPNTNSQLKSILCGTGSYTLSESKLQAKFAENMSKNAEKQVTLAKKNLYPVTSRILLWLHKAIESAEQSFAYTTLTQQDKQTLMNATWSKLLVLYMAENNFHFAVTVVAQGKEQLLNYDVTNIGNTDIPTMTHADGIQAFVTKCQDLHLTVEDYELIRLAVLFYMPASTHGLKSYDEPLHLEAIHKLYLKQLQQHMMAKDNNKGLLYSRLLMLLPTLYSISNKVVEKLFCSHLEINTSFQNFLVQLIDNYQARLV